MKQHITIEDLNTLTDEQKKRLREWWNPKVGDWYADWDKFDHKFTESLYFEVAEDSYYSDEPKKEDNDLPLLSIGQMIEMLLTSGKYMFDLYLQASVKEKSYVYDGWGNVEIGIHNGEGTYVCDALFEAVKQCLNV